MNKYFGVMSTQPGYVIGGYECPECKCKVKTKDEYNEHIFEKHTKLFAYYNMDWVSYKKYYEPEEYKEYLKEKKRKKEYRKKMKKAGYWWDSTFHIWRKKDDE